MGGKCSHHCVIPAPHALNAFAPTNTFNTFNLKMMLSFKSLCCFTCSLYTLAEMFELPPAVVHSTISKMIINEELQVFMHLFVLGELFYTVPLSLFCHVVKSDNAARLISDQ